jgi:hypothetical protein
MILRLNEQPKSIQEFDFDVVTSFLKTVGKFECVVSDDIAMQLGSG